MKTYTVAYLMDGIWQCPKEIEVQARNEFEAYDKATFEAIPEKEGRIPYASYVDSVRYKNGRVHQFYYDITNSH